MRRREIAGEPIPDFFGNTSACAEKRLLSAGLWDIRWKYLRVCGEECWAVRVITGWLEIPPRVRRRDLSTMSMMSCPGNTSACAEKSLPTSVGVKDGWKYLRVCGEELSACKMKLPSLEIPPRVRRREFPTCGFTKKFLQVREFRQIRSQAATDHRSPESLGDYSPSYLRRTPALGWDHY